MLGISGDEPVAITKRRALMRYSPALTRLRSRKRAGAPITLTLRPVKRSAASLGAMAAITPRTWLLTAAWSMAGLTGAMPRGPAVRMAWARAAAASNAFDGTQP